MVLSNWVFSDWRTVLFGFLDLYVDFLLCCFRIKDMYNHVNERSGLKAPLVADDVYEIIMKVCVFYLYELSLGTLV